MKRNTLRSYCLLGLKTQWPFNLIEISRRIRLLFHVDCTYDRWDNRRCRRCFPITRKMKMCLSVHLSLAELSEATPAKTSAITLKRIQNRYWWRKALTQQWKATRMAITIEPTTATATNTKRCFIYSILCAFYLVIVFFVVRLLFNLLLCTRIATKFGWLLSRV